MRRPGNLAGTDYWFGDIPPNFVNGKLADIAADKIRNNTPLTEAQRRGRLHDVLNGKKPGNITH